MVSSLVSDSGWSSASHSDSSCPASSSVGAAPSSLHPDHRAAPRFPAHPAHQRSNRQTQSRPARSGLGSPGPQRKLLHLGPHPLGPSSHHSYIPQAQYRDNTVPKKWSHIKRVRNIRSDLTRAHRSAASSRQQKAPGTRTNHIPGALQCVELRGAGYAASCSSGVCVRRVTRRARNLPWRGGQWPSPNRWCPQRHPACRDCGRASWRGRRCR